MMLMLSLAIVMIPNRSMDNIVAMAAVDIIR